MVALKVSKLKEENMPRGIKKIARRGRKKRPRPKFIKCRKCGVTKSNREYYNSRRVCKACWKAHMNEYRKEYMKRPKVRAKRRVYIREYMRRYRAKLRKLKRK